MSDNEFIFYWFATFFIWNIYYLWIVPKRSAEFWSRRFESKEGQKELVKIARGIIDTTVEETNMLIEEQLQTFQKSFFGSFLHSFLMLLSLYIAAWSNGDLARQVRLQTWFFRMDFFRLFLRQQLKEDFDRFLTV